MGLDNSKKSIFCIEKRPTFADEISEDRLHLSIERALCIRFALSLPLQTWGRSESVCKCSLRLLPRKSASLQQRLKVHFHFAFGSRDLWLIATFSPDAPHTDARTLFIHYKRSPERGRRKRIFFIMTRTEIQEFKIIWLNCWISTQNRNTSN